MFPGLVCIGPYGDADENSYFWRKLTLFDIIYLSCSKCYWNQGIEGARLWTVLETKCQIKANDTKTVALNVDDILKTTNTKHTAYGFSFQNSLNCLDWTVRPRPMRYLSQWLSISNIIKYPQKGMSPSLEINHTVQSNFFFLRAYVFGFTSP